ncbi:MAG: cyclic nucleotide-binding domain-containing protein, partial [Anaerolineae bacterium]|nr:cyclic nucleotide-binding domain-containing protein [Anaerolineae bacterium]
LSGQVEIRFKPDDAETLTVAVLEAGGVFGWSAGLGRKEYTSGAICTQDTRLLSVEGAALRQLCEVRPETGVLI